MKHILLLLFAVAFCNSLFSQKIVKAEYFVDGSDLGFGKNTPISIASDDQNANVALTANTNLSSINVGMHTLSFRVQDENKRWSLAAQQLFQVVSVPATLNITKAEYYIDHIPVDGSGTNIAISSPAQDLTLTHTLDLNAILPGLRTLYVRVKDNSNRWSILSSQLFYVLSSKEIAKVKSFEYYFKGTNGNTASYTYTNFTPGLVVELKDADFVATATDLEYEKQYTLYIRALNDNEKYSAYNTLLFTFKKLGTGWKDLNSEGMYIYPNPVNDILFLAGKEYKPCLDYFIYNQVGKAISNGKINNQQIDIQQLSSGNYILVIKEGNTIYKGEIFIKK